MILRHDDSCHLLGVLASVLIGCGATGAAGPVSNHSTGGASAGGAATGGASNAAVGGGNPAGGQSPTTGGAGGGADTGGSSAIANPTGGAGPTGGAAPTGGAPPCVPGTQIGTSTTNYFIMAYGQLKPFYVFNNGWSTKNTNLTAAGTKESITAFDTCTSGTISWKTDYDWSGANNTVKAYPCAVLGWQSTKGWQVSSQTMLPKTISSISSAKCSWTYTVTGGASQDVAFDIWVHSTTCSQSAITADTAASDEVMIWLYSNGGVQPAGSKSQSGLSISGATWDLWEGNVSSWKVHSYVRTSNSNSVTDLDVLAFLNKSGLGSKCLSSIEAGTEVFQGSGTVNTSSYTCSVQ